MKNNHANVNSKRKEMDRGVKSKNEKRIDEKSQKASNETNLIKKIIS